MFEMWKSISDFAVIIFLGSLSICDIRSKKLPIYVFVVAGIAGIILAIINKDIFTVKFIINLLPGIAAMIICKITKEAIGYGDGLAILILGLFIPLSEMLSSFLIGISICGIVALVMVLFFHKKKNAEIAFIPFLMAGVILSGGVL